MSSLSEITSKVASAASTAVGLVGTAKGVISQVSSISSVNASELVKSLPTTASSWLSTASSVLGMSSITGILTKGTSQAISKIKKLVGSDSEAIKNPIAFTSKTVKETVEGIQTSADLASTVSNIPANLSKTTLSNIASRAGLSSISSVSDLTTANTTTGQNIVTALTSADTLISAMPDSLNLSPSGLATNLTDGLRSTNTSVTSETPGTANELISVVADIAGVASAICVGTKMVENALSTTGTSKMASNYQSQVKYLKSDYVSTATQTSSTRLANNLAIILDAFPDSDEATTSFSKVNSLTTKSYPLYKDSTTLEDIALLNSSSKLSSSEVNAILSTAAVINPNATLPTVTPYSQQKDLYDTTLDIATQNGMGTVVNALSQNTVYSDSRSTNVLLSNIPSLITNGDFSTYQVVVGIVGAQKISNPEEQLRVLAANSQATAENQRIFNQLLTSFQLQASDLVAGSTYGNITTVDTNKLAQISASDATWGKLVCSEEDYAMNQQALAMYG